MKSLLVALLGLAFACVGCSKSGSSSPGDTGILSLAATDAPFTHGVVSEAHVFVTKIRVHSDGQANSGFTTIYDGPAIDLDLLALQNGVTQQLVQATLPAGDYAQIRLVVSDASLTLTNGNVYSTTAGNLHLTSQQTSGFKLKIEPPIHVSSAVSQSLLLDFDLAKMFKPIPGNQPLTASTYQLHPVIHVANLSTSGELRGLVTADDGSGTQVGVGGATVHVLPPGELDPNNSVATTGTLPDGRWAVLGLDAGTYDVLAIEGPRQGRVNGEVVSVGNATTVDIVIQ